MSLVEDLPERSGYLLKDRVSEIGSLADALRRIGDGECVIYPTIVSRLVSHRRNAGPLAELTAREREVLALMAEGHSNQGICERLFLSPKTLEGHVGNIFRKLAIGDAPDYHALIPAGHRLVAERSRTARHSLRYTLALSVPRQAAVAPLTMSLLGAQGREPLRLVERKPLPDRYRLREALLRDRVHTRLER